MPLTQCFNEAARSVRCLVLKRKYIFNQFATTTKQPLCADQMLRGNNKVINWRPLLASCVTNHEFPAVQSIQRAIAVVKTT